ncbi:helix-turn-helix domain-containing protein [Chromobacterium subtsugae]|uniref:helix-turn-helix domain-containing protein n=1 Tax=Chromobacterium subtsugae TaxID=251747 RepID=UPI0009BD2063
MNGPGTRIRAERIALHLSQEKLARRAGVSRGVISDLERGRSRGTTHLLAIAKSLNVRAQWIETGKEPKRPTPAPENTFVAATSMEDLADRLLEMGPDAIGRLWSLILQRKIPD